MNALGFTFVSSHKPFLYLYCVILARLFRMRNVAVFFWLLCYDSVDIYVI